MLLKRVRRAVSAWPKAVPVCLVAAGLALSACSSRPQSHQVSWSAAGEPQGAPMVQVRREAEVEDDGMEAQVAPPPSIRLAPDDPKEPWSPNYGARPADSPPAPAVKPAGPPALRPTIRPRYASAAH
jgi:hypothetical protein